MLAVLLSPQLLQAYLICQQQWVRMHMKEELERQALTTIYVPKEELTWIRKEKEISWQGRYFDIKHSEALDNGLMKLKGLYDEQETAIKQKAAAAGKTEQQNAGKNLLHWLAITGMVCPPVSTCVSSMLPALPADYAVAGPAALLFRCKDVVTPPPLG